MPHIGFALSVDQNQFVSMAKIRALRRLWARIQEACAIPSSPTVVHAETSMRMISRLEFSDISSSIAMEEMKYTTAIPTSYIAIK